MSGKKKSEVKMVLKSAEKTRQDIFDARFNELEDIIKKFQEISSKFPVDDMSIEQELANVKDIKEELNKLNLDVQNLQNKLASTDPAKTHYFDREYQEAESFFNKYKQINESLKDVYIRIEGKISDVLQRNKDSEKEALEKFDILISQLKDRPYNNPLDPDERLSLEELIKKSLKQPELFEPIESLVDSIKKNLDEKNFISALDNVNNAFDKIKEVKDQSEENPKIERTN